MTCHDTCVFTAAMARRASDPPPPAAVPTAPFPRTVHRLPVGTEDVFEIDVRYSGLVYIARGAYGMVCVADDAVSGARGDVIAVSIMYKRRWRCWRDCGACR